MKDDGHDWRRRRGWPAMTIGCVIALAMAACTPARSPVAAPTGTPADAPARRPTVLNAQPPAGAATEFRTDFSKSLVSFEDILSGGPPKDGIPAIDAPKYVSIAEADTWLKPLEPVIRVEINGEARAYPLQILTWHEIVNDTLGGAPVVISFCPLCNTAIAFRREADGRVLDFGTTGRLRYSNLIMYDRQTESWWQQATGQAIVGELAGARLEFVPAAIIGWQDFKQTHPTGSVLSRDTGHKRDYGRNPYVGYDDVTRPPFLYQGPRIDSALPPVARVLGVEINGEAVAYPYDALETQGVINDTVGSAPVAVVWQAGAASALDAPIISEGRDVGAAVAYDRRVGEITLTFRMDNGRIVDEQTGSVWRMTGRAVEGALAGQALTPVVAVNHFWFSWSVFKPDARVYSSQSTR